MQNNAMEQIFIKLNILEEDRSKIRELVSDSDNETDIMVNIDLWMNYLKFKQKIGER